jgi:hypothetical protein
MKFTVDFMLSKLFPNVNNNPKKIAPRLFRGRGTVRKRVLPRVVLKRMSD